MRLLRAGPAAKEDETRMPPTAGSWAGTAWPKKEEMAQETLELAHYRCEFDCVPVSVKRTA